MSRFIDRPAADVLFPITFHRVRAGVLVTGLVPFGAVAAVGSLCAALLGCTEEFVDVAQGPAMVAACAEAGIDRATFFFVRRSP